MKLEAIASASGGAAIAVTGRAVRKRAAQPNRRQSAWASLAPAGGERMENAQAQWPARTCAVADGGAGVTL
jgi:hypothetical protein